MEKEKNVVDFYRTCNKLKEIIRTGWINWGVNKSRLESIAEHIFGVQMLALAMQSEYPYDLDIKKVLYMLAIHDLGEAKIGDLTQFDISKAEKEIIELKAIHEVFSPLLKSDEILDLYFEFEEKKTQEAIFAYQCDKLECDLQSRIYDQEGVVDLEHQEGNPAMKNSLVRDLLEKGASWSEMWIKFGQATYPYDNNFRAVSEYALEHDLKNPKDLVYKYQCKDE